MLVFNGIVHISYERGNGEPNLGGRPGWGLDPLQLRDSAGLCFQINYRLRL